MSSPPPYAESGADLTVERVVDGLRSAGAGPGEPVAVVVVLGGLGLAAGRRQWQVPTADPAGVVAALQDALAPRWTCWRAGDLHLLTSEGLRLRTCWDLAAVHRLLHGGRRDDPAAVWAAAAGLAAPPPPEDDLVLLDRAGAQAGSTSLVRPDGHLDPSWAADRGPAGAAALAGCALAVRDRQHASLAARPDPRAEPGQPALALLTAYAESAAALLAVELEQEGLPVDRGVAAALLTGLVGPPGASPADRDLQVLRHFRTSADLRNPLQVRGMLAAAGIDVPDTRSWRLEPFRAGVPGVAALLEWRRTERIATTYGWSWLARHVGADGRLRGSWAASDGGAGRMAASAGLHNLPAALRTVVRADPGMLLVRGDLGQVEPRVLAVVSGDVGLARAARDDDMYAPVAAALGCDRPTAKVAVLAAMYGQTTGTAGAALARMERAYPRALAYLHEAQERGRQGLDVMTWGGRRVPVGGPGADTPDTDPAADRGRGRYARNAVVQGAAAELFKAWAATVRTGLLADCPQARIVLCLHDELLLHVPADAAADCAQLLRDALATTSARWAAGSGVRFVVEVATGRTWAEAKR